MTTDPEKEELETQPEGYTSEIITTLGEEYANLNERLNKLNTFTSLRAIFEIVYKMRQILINTAKGTPRSMTIYQKIANKLTLLIFNRFHITNFDNLRQEVIAVQTNPIAPMKILQEVITDKTPEKNA